MKMKNLLISFGMLAYSLFGTLASAQSWNLQGNVGGGKVRAAAVFVIGSKAYIGGGDRGGPLATYDFWEWDQASNVWTQKANMGVARWLAVGFSIGAKGYVATGDDGNGLSLGGGGTKTIWEWDQAGNTWTQRAQNTSGPYREQAVGFSIGNFGYITTGSTGYSCPAGMNTDLNDLWQYDPATDSWSQKANLPGPARYGATGFVIGTKGYVMMGMDKNSVYYNDVWEWDQPTNTWAQMASMPGTARSHAASFAIAGKGYMGTGVDKMGNNLNDFWRWEQATNTWKQMPNFGGNPRYLAIGFSIGNKGYLGTGDSGPVCQDGSKIEEVDLWEFQDSVCVVSASVMSDPSTTVCMGAQVFIHASGGTAYSWNTGETTSYIQVAPTVTTTYSVLVTDVNGCSGTVTHTVPVDPNCNSATGVASLDNQVQVSISPNPFTERAVINVAGAEGHLLTEVEIFDLLGQKVRHVIFSGNQAILERGDLQSGIYFYKISFPDSKGSEKAMTGRFVISGK